MNLHLEDPTPSRSPRGNLFPPGSLLPGVALLLLAAAAGGCAGTGAEAAGDADALMPAVEAVPARWGSLPLVERVSGVARAANQVQLRPEIAGIVGQVLVQSGERVRQGQPLVRLRDVTQREQLQQAEAAVRLAEAAARQAEARVAELRALTVRARTLAEEQLISSLELETRESQLAAAQASAASERARVEREISTVEEQRSELERTVVRAPLDGHVGRRLVEVGMRVDPGTVLFVLGDLDRLVVEVPLTESMLGYIEPGLPVTLASRALGGAPVAATLSRISPFLSQESFSTTGEIDVPNDGGALRPGMFLTVDILYGESRNAALVPASAVWEDPRSGEAFLFVVDRDGAGVPPAAALSELSPEALPIQRRPAQVEASGRATVGVAGVAEGEWVVIVGQHLLAESADSAARVRLVTWERVLELQGMQREDLLSRFLDKQRRVAREQGATPPPTGEYVGGAAGSRP